MSVLTVIETTRSRSGGPGSGRPDEPTDGGARVLAFPVARARAWSVPAAGVAQGRRGGARMELTSRGIAVVVTLLLALFATALVVLVTAFLSVSNEPPVLQRGPVAAVADAGPLGSV